MLDANAIYAMFYLSVPVIEKVIRPVLLYFVLIFVLRFFGKRELAQLNPFDLVVLMTLSNSVQNAIVGDDYTITGGVIGAVILLLTNYLTVRRCYSPKAERLRKILQGSERVLMEDGRVRKEELKAELMRESELAIAARRQGFDSLDEVERATLEPGGILVFEHKDPDREEREFCEILRRLDAITLELQQLRRQT